MDWRGSDLIEQIPGKQDGVPLIKETRIPADQFVEEYELDSPVEAIADNYPSVTRDQIRGPIAFV